MGAGLLLLVLGAGAFTGSAFSVTDRNAIAQLEQYQQSLDQSQQDLVAMRGRHEEHLNALALQLGELQARSVRMDSLGARLTQVGQLSDGEFNFLAPPPVGGPEEAVVLADLGSIDWPSKLNNFRHALMISRVSYAF